MTRRKTDASTSHSCPNWFGSNDGVCLIQASGNQRVGVSGSHCCESEPVRRATALYLAVEMATSSRFTAGTFMGSVSEPRTGDVYANDSNENDCVRGRDGGGPKPCSAARADRACVRSASILRSANGAHAPCLLIRFIASEMRTTVTVLTNSYAFDGDRILHRTKIWNDVVRLQQQRRR
jgi:hypothetical protein